MGLACHAAIQDTGTAAQSGAPNPAQKNILFLYNNEKSFPT